ncbi:MAG: DMT family transporter [Alphaproteobacteria bacterium]|nr:DMT family transporter [Hyphomicrobiales bacterium]MBU1317391.1 DMT family transporter [Alphaproteobacteria bacterium]MBU1551823.1 DMT family transporter [Alphaproteobacteria bacterium]MBU2335251.1 DMT family transporter [Alphaproteobacteria bacterium]MBU2391281.1 DMT family transporter [Alphaproteobacteria bacterium]
MSDHRKGLVLTTIGGLALSFDVPLVKLGDGELWSVIALRSLVTCAAAIVLWLLAGYFSKRRPVLVPGRAGLLAGLCYGLSTMTFLGAVFLTATANVVFIVAFTPMFAALFGWLVLKEVPSLSTVLTMVAMAAGVALIVAGGLEAGGLLGDLLAALTSALLAGAITIARKTRSDMGFVPLVATALPALIGLAMVANEGFAVAAPVWIVFDGAVMIPLAFWCLATGPRYLSGPEVGMFYLLETILAPIWVWMIFSEVPTAQTVAGGAILVSALILHSAWQMRAKAQSAHRSIHT